MPLSRFAERSAMLLRDQVARGMRAFLDPALYFVIALGLVAWLLPSPVGTIPWVWLLLKAVPEEIFFRACLLETLNRVFEGRFRLGPLSLANVLTSLAFAGVHMLYQPPAWALLTFFPSLIFGWVWERYRSIIPVWVVHSLYNVFLFYRVWSVPSYHTWFWGN